MNFSGLYRAFKLAAFASLSTLAFNATAIDFENFEYDVYVGDQNGDGIDDIYLSAKDSFIPIHGEVLVPLSVQLADNYVLQGGDGFYYDPFVVEDIDLTNFTLVPNAVVYDYNEDGSLDLVIGESQNIITNIALLGSQNTSAPILVADIDKYDVLSTPPTPGSIGLAESLVSGEILKISDSLAPIAGEFRVTEGGGAIYSIPIYTPPGTAGVAPQISLSYSSQAGNGLLGLGWSLSGLSSITRCRQTMATDGHPRPITWTKEDRYCLDGQRLLLQTGTEYGAVGATYKTEVDNFATVTSVGGTLGHPAYFLMKSKDGSTSAFGNTPNASFKNTNNETLNWAISKFSDSVGNKIDFSYITTAHSQRISRIDYGSASVNHSALVFQYELRPYDKMYGYTAGFKTETINRLTGIQVSTNSSVLRHYFLNYDQANTEFSRIVKVEECIDSFKSACRGSTEFDWQYPARGLSLGSETLYSLDTTGFVDFKPLDINADGYVDLAYIRASGGGSNHYFAYAISDGETLHKDPTEVTYVEDVGRHTVKLEVIDYNADGRSDVLVFNELDSKWTLFLSELQSNGSWRLIQKSIVLPFNKEEVSFGDIDSDGLVDGFYYSAGALYVYPLVKSGASIASNQYYKFASSPTTYPISVTGSPTISEVYTACGQLQYRASGSADVELYPGAIGDYNADGRIDLVFSVEQSFITSSDYVPPGGGIQPRKVTNSLTTSSTTTTTSSTTTRSPYVPEGVSCADNGFKLKNYVAYSFPKNSESPLYLGRLLDKHSYNDYDDKVRVLSVDINADGVSDIVSLNKTNTDFYIWSAKLGTGLGYGSGMSLVSGKENDIDNSAQFSDFNNDGYLDFIYHDHINSRLRTKSWLPSSEIFETDFQEIPRYSADLTSFEYSYSPELTQTYQKAAPVASTFFYASDDSNDSYFFLNLDGNGGEDLVHLDVSAKTLRVFKNKQTGPINHSIKRIKNGLGAETVINYENSYVSDHYMGLNIANSASTELQQVCVDVTEQGDYVENCFNRTKTILSSNQFYTALNNPFAGLPNQRTAATAMAPVTENPSNGYFVTTVSSSSPTAINPNAMSSVSYFYEESKLQAAGRGPLGYKKLSTLDHQTGVETTTTYRQDYPYLGSPQKTETSFNGSLISKSTNTWNSKVIQGVNHARYQPYVSQSEETNFKVVSSYANGFSVEPTIVSNILTNNTYDNYGNVIQSVVTTFGDGNTYSTTTNSIYGSSVEAQEMGRLSQSTVRHSRPHTGEADIVRTSKFNYYGFGCSGPEAMWGLLCSEQVYSGSQYEMTTTYEYDAYGNQIKSTSVTAGEPSRVAISSYASYGRYMDQAINHYGQITQDVISWDNYGQPNEVKDLLGTSMSSKYTVFGEQYLDYNQTGGFSVSYRELATNCPTGSVYKAVSKAPDNAESFQCVDKLGRAIRKATKLLNGDWSYSDSEYDTLGRMTRQSEPYKPNSTIYWTIYYYDILGNVIRMDQPDFAGNLRNSYVNYNALTKTDINVLSQTQSETKNALGELVEIRDNLGTKVQYLYNPIGDLRFTKTNAGSITHIVEVRYDNYGHKTHTIDPDKGTWTYSYNGYGELNTQTNANGDVRRFTYDSLGRQIKREEPDGTTSWVYNNTNAGNSRGQMEYEILFDANGNIPYQMNYTYDGFGRVSEMKTTIDGEEFSERTTYDAYGRNFQSFDAASVQNAMQYQYKNGHMYKVVNAANTNEVYYQANVMDARGNVNQFKQGAVVTDRTYDDKTGFLTSVKSSVLGVFGTQDLSYNWDALSNLKSRTEKSGNKNLVESFGYDGLNRLSWSEVSGRTRQNYVYDLFGNTTSKTGVGNYKYGSACINGAGPHAVCEINNDGTTEAFDYDNNGNMLTHRVNGTVDRQFVYSSFDKPTRITKGNHTTEFEYGADRSRYKRVDNNDGEITTTLYIGSIEILTKPDNSREIRRYINGSVLVTQDYNLDANGDYQFARAVTRNILTDHLGSTDVITDINGQIVQEQSFDAWGARRATTDGVRLDNISLISFADINNQYTTKGFTGHESVDQVGVIHMNGRIYDARLGRFLQADPNIDGADTTQGFNRYSYVKNNPLNATDPTGFFLDKLFGHLNKALGDFAPYFSIALLAIPGVGAWAASSWLNAAAIGFVSGGVSTGSLKGAIQGAVGSVSGAAFSAVGDFVGAAVTSGVASAGGSFLAGAISGGIQSVLSGGKFGHGFASAGINQVVGGRVEGLKNKFVRAGAAALVGGTKSVITGGKFKNGAASASFLYAIRSGSELLKDIGEESRVAKELAGLTEEQKQENFEKNYETFERALSVIGDVTDLEVPSAITVVDTDEYLAGVNCGLRGCDDVVSVSKQWLQTGRDYKEFIATAYHEVLHFNDTRFNNFLMGNIEKFGGESARHRDITDQARLIKFGGLAYTEGRKILDEYNERYNPGK